MFEIVEMRPRKPNKYLSIQERIYRCNHYVPEVGNKFRVCSHAEHKERPVGTFGPPWVRFHRIYRCTRADTCRCIRLCRPRTFHHSAIQNTYSCIPFLRSISCTFPAISCSIYFAGVFHKVNVKYFCSFITNLKS